ncbi:YiiG family protein [Stenotrophomonas sp.]|uniref:YiiG family protein n=1 Tax=Stenotrophomonas sp. TaxID=69392 RepID=UPI002FC7DE16
MKQVVSAAVLAAAIGLALSACGGGDKAPTAAKEAAGSAAPDNMEAQQALTAKLNDYIDCYNSMDADLHRGITVYTRWIDDVEAGPTGKEGDGYGPAQVDAYRLKKCDEAITRAQAAKPALPALDGAAKDYLAQLHALAPLAEAAYSYYNRDDFEDDGFARGKQMHAPLMAALQAFTASSERFSDALEAQNDEAQRAQLAALEKADGRTMEFYRLSMMLEAKALVDFMSEDTFDVAAGAERIAAFNAISDEAHAKVKPEANSTGWSTFEMSAEQFRRESKERLARVRDKKPYSKLEKGWMDHPTLAPGGSPLKLMNAYNDLVQRGNRL